MLNHVCYWPIGSFKSRTHTCITKTLIINKSTVNTPFEIVEALGIWKKEEISCEGKATVLIVFLNFYKCVLVINDDDGL